MDGEALTCVEELDEELQAGPVAVDVVRAEPHVGVGGHAVTEQ
jgi:hypothetical protein